MNHVFKHLLALAITVPVLATQGQTLSSPQSTDPHFAARFGTNQKGNFFVQGEILWVKPLGMNFSQRQVNTSGANTSQIYFSNQFTTGERVGIGYNTSYDSWDVLVEFTGFNYSHNNAGVSNYSLANTFYTVTGTTNYTYYFNQGDLDFGRMMQVSSKIKMRPHLGARVLWLNEQAQFSYAANTYATQKNKNTLGGLELGVDSLWYFSKAFSIYANLGLTTLVNQQKTIFRTNDSNLKPSFHTNYGSKIIGGYDIKIGLRWDKNFSDNSYHFGLNFGYEQHSLININGSNGLLGALAQNLYQSFYDTDFSWQAMALGARFDF